MPKTVLITGAAKRIGRALALHYARQGWQVAAHYHRSQADAQSLLAEAGQGVALFQADLSQALAGRTLMDAVVAKFGVPDLLINNAARFERDDGVIAEDHYLQHMAVNCLAPIELIQQFYAYAQGAAQEMAQGRRRVAINFLDAMLAASLPHFTCYALSKTALEQWTRLGAGLLLPYVHVHGFRLGPTMINPRETMEHFNQLIAATPSGKATTIEAIVMAITACLRAEEMQETMRDV